MTNINFDVWKQHFVKQAKGLLPREDSFYPVTTEVNANRSISDGQIKVDLVSPVQQAVERAESDINSYTPIYDPVTGVTRHSSGKLRSVRKKRATKGNPHKKKVKKTKKRGLKFKKRKLLKLKKKNKKKKKKNKKGK
jgi:hypothetical protein